MKKNFTISVSCLIYFCAFMLPLFSYAQPVTPLQILTLSGVLQSKQAVARVTASVKGYLPPREFNPADGVDLDFVFTVKHNKIIKFSGKTIFFFPVAIGGEVNLAELIALSYVFVQNSPKSKAAAFSGTFTNLAGQLVGFISLGVVNRPILLDGSAILAITNHNEEDPISLLGDAILDRQFTTETAELALDE